MAKKNYDYFAAFSACAAFAKEAALFLQNAMNNFSVQTFKAEMDKMHAIENAADEKKHEIMEHLAHEFITPIELEDIVSISQELDNVVDSIDDVMRKMYMFSVTEVLPEAIQFSDLIVDCVSKMNSVIDKFSNFKKARDIHPDIIEVNRIETVGDALHLSSLHSLYADSTDAVHILKWSRMFDSFEDCLDACENVSDIVEGVIMKNT
jgi:Phosphate transport regulator (distant homolog of PhoU)